MNQLQIWKTWQLPGCILKRLWSNSQTFYTRENSMTEMWAAQDFRSSYLDPNSNYNLDSEGEQRGVEQWCQAHPALRAFSAGSISHCCAYSRLKGVWYLATGLFPSLHSISQSLTISVELEVPSLLPLTICLRKTFHRQYLWLDRLIPISLHHLF